MIWALIWKYVVGAGIVVALGTGVWFYGHGQYKAGVTDTQTAAKLAAEAQYKADVLRLTATSYTLQAKIDELQNAQPKIVSDYKAAVVKAPLAPTCLVDDGRLLSINAAIAAANAAGQSGATVPTHPGAAK